MALILSAVPNALGRILYRQGGKFISKNKYLRELRRGVGGRFGTKVKQVSGLSKSGIAEQLMQEMGAPMGGGTWHARVKKSGKKFADMLSGQL